MFLAVIGLLQALVFLTIQGEMCNQCDALDLLVDRGGGRVAASTGPRIVNSRDVVEGVVVGNGVEGGQLAVVLDKRDDGASGVQVSNIKSLIEMLLIPLSPRQDNWRWPPPPTPPPYRVYGFGFVWWVASILLVVGVVERADEQLMMVVGDTRVGSANGVAVSNINFYQLLRFSSQDYGLISSTPFGHLGSCIGCEHVDARH